MGGHLSNPTGDRQIIMADEATTASTGATNTPLMSGFENAERTTSLATPPQPSLVSPDVQPTAAPIPGAPAPIPPSTKGTGVSDSTSTSTSPDAPPEGYDDAVAFLKDEGVPESFLASADREELVAYAAAQAELAENAETEGASRVTEILERLEANLGSGKSTPETSGDGAKTPAAKTAAPTAEGVVTADQKIENLEARVAYMTAMLESATIDKWVQRTKDEYPAVTDTGIQEKVTRFAAILVQSRQETNIDKAFDVATKVVMAQDHGGQTSMSRRALVAKLRSKTALTTPDGANKKNVVANMTADQLRDKQLELVLTGDSEAGFKLGKEFEEVHKAAM